MKAYSNTGDIPRFIQDQMEPTWYKELRNQAFSLFEQVSWPSLKDEEWRRTDISSFDLDGLSFVGSEPGVSVTTHPTEGYAGAISFTNGTSTLASISAQEQGNGVVFQTLDQFLADNSEPTSPQAKAFTKGFQQSLDSADNKVYRWSLAAASYGVVLYVPKNHECSAPFRIDFKADKEDMVTMPQVAVILEQGAKAVVELCWSGQGGFLINQNNFFVVGNGANLSFTQMQTCGDEVVVFTNGKSIVERDARFRHFESILGGGFVKNRVDSSLVGPGSDLELDGIYFADEERHMDLRTVQHHYSDHAVSNAVYRGAVADEAHTIYQGLIEVSPKGKGTDAYLSNKNLVLNDGAQADSIPCLQINTDDVRCSHGSTTGKLRADQIFYLMSRGFSREQAQEALILAYFQEVLGRVHESLQDEIVGLLEHQISKIKADMFQ